MATTIKEAEAIPAAFPASPGGLSAAAILMDPEAVWQRIEAWCRTRWTPREVVWTVEAGAGDQWEAPIGPVSAMTAERWTGAAWEAVTLMQGPVGYCIPSSATYRVTATVGGGDVPPAVLEAFRRLAEYLVDEPDRAGVSSYSVNMGGAIEESYRRTPAWAARALELSGAADLLRPYKRRA